MEATFRAGGLASGLDTNSIIDNLVKIERRSIDAVQRQKEALSSQVSLLGDVSSKLAGLAKAASTLVTDGVLKARSTGLAPTGFTVTPGSSASAGRYSVEVVSQAQAAKARSASFSGAEAAVTGATLSLSVRGTTTELIIDDGETLSSVARKINESGAAVNATVLTSSEGTFLSVTARDTGFVPGQAPQSALTISSTTTGTAGQALGLGVLSAAVNAQVRIDGLTFERASNVISDAVPGATITVTAATAPAQDVVLDYDGEATEKALQTFADSYNELTKLLREQLNVAQATDRRRTLAGDGAIRGLQAAVMGLVTSQLPGTGPVRSLADLGFRTQVDGTLKLDRAKLESAIGADAQAVNALFSTATTGLKDLTASLEKRYTDASEGILVARKNGLNDSLKAMDRTIESLELRVEKFKERLIKQFSAMEKVVNTFRSLGNFLTSQEKKESTS